MASAAQSKDAEETGDQHEIESVLGKRPTSSVDIDTDAIDIDDI